MRDQPLYFCLVSVFVCNRQQWWALEFSSFRPCQLPPACCAPAPGLPHTGEARVSLCPWGHQQTGTLRLEYPRVRGGSIILACLALRSPKSRLWVPASHSEASSCWEMGTRREAARGTEDTQRYSVPTPNPPSRHVIRSPARSSFQPQAGARTSPGHLLCLLPGGSPFRPSHIQKTSAIHTILGQGS